MKAKEFDKKFDAGKDVAKHLDFSRGRRPKQEQKRVNVDFPVWMIQTLDKEARRLGVPRQSLIKMLIAEHLEKSHAGTISNNSRDTIRNSAVSDPHSRSLKKEKGSYRAGSAVSRPLRGAV